MQSLNKDVGFLLIVLHQIFFSMREIFKLLGECCQTMSMFTHLIFTQNSLNTVRQKFGNEKKLNLI